MLQTERGTNEIQILSTSLQTPTLHCMFRKVIQQHFHNCSNSILRNIRYSRQLRVTQKVRTFYAESSQNGDDFCPQEVFDFGVTSLCMFLKKCDFGQSLTVQRTSKKFKITNIDSTLLRSVSDLDRGQPNIGLVLLTLCLPA